jgi:TatD DNase family protein
MLIDTHAHLGFADFEKDLREVVGRAKKAGVNKIICVSSNVGEARKAIEIGQKFPGIVFPAVGIHPQKTDPENLDLPKEQINQLAKLASQKEVIAVGECGLDFSPAPPGEKEREKETQDLLFREQLKIAEKYKLPVCIHSREALTEALAALADFPKIKGVFHCYAGGKKGIEKVKQLGDNWYFGVDGNLTYDEGLQNVFKLIPLEKIILETDSPFLAPIPYRGQRNEPKNLKLITEALAQIKAVSLEKITQITSQNTFSLFPRLLTD